MSAERTAEDAGPLSGLGVLVTRDVRQSAELSNKLKALGANVFEFPVIEIRHPESIERLAQLDAAIREIGSYDWIVFASINAVDYFLSRVRKIQPNIAISTLFKDLAIGAVGGKTAERIKQNCLKVAFIPREFSGDAFAREITLAHNVDGKKFLWPRTNVGETQIKDQLQQHGATVDVVVAYETGLPTQAHAQAHELRQLLDSGKVNVVTLTSTQSVRNFYLIVGPAKTAGSVDDDAHRFSFEKKITIATIGAETAKAASQHFNCRIIQTEHSTIDGLIECVEQLRK